MTVAFNGVTKRIAVSSLADFATVDVEKDIYSEWKAWVALTDNAKYLQALRPVGGDPIGGTQTVPPYFFLMNDWKIEVDGIQNLGFNTNLYCEEASNVFTNPFLITNNGSVINKTSDAPVNTIEVSTIAYSLELGGKVYLDVDNGSDTGTHLGTIAVPVKTLTKAIAICASENISSIHLAGTLPLDQDVSGLEFVSWKNGKIDMNEQPCMATRFRELKLFGTQHTGSMALVFDCRLANLQGMLGVFDDCKFLDATPLVVQSGTTSLGHCSTQIEGAGGLTLDCSAGSIVLDIRGLSAALQLTNVLTSNDVMSIGFASGLLQLSSSCIDGNVYAGGASQLIDNRNDDGCKLHIESKNATPETVWRYKRDEETVPPVPPVTVSLDFSDADNSQYIGVL